MTHLTAVIPTFLEDAISSGDPDKVSEVLGDMEGEDARNAVLSCCQVSRSGERNYLMREAQKGNVAMLLGVLTELWQRCSLQQVGAAFAILVWRPEMFTMGLH